MEENNRTPEEIEEKKKALESKKKRHRVSSTLRAARRALKIAAITSIGLFGKPGDAEAQGYTLTPVKNVPTATAERAAYGTVEWAEEQGYVYDPIFSQGINRRGTINDRGEVTHFGYLGVFINRYNPDKLMVLPNDPIHNRVQTYSAREIKDFQKHRTGPFKRSNMRILGRGVYRHGGWRY